MRTSIACVIVIGVRDWSHRADILLSVTNPPSPPSAPDWLTDWLQCWRQYVFVLGLHWLDMTGSGTGDGLRPLLPGRRSSHYGLQPGEARLETGEDISHLTSLATKCQMKYQPDKPPCIYIDDKMNFIHVQSEDRKVVLRNWWISFSMYRNFYFHFQSE